MSQAPAPSNAVATGPLGDRPMSQDSGPGRATWEFRFKAFTALATIVSMVSIIVGAVVGIRTYVEKSDAEQAIKLKELRLMEYQQKRDVYYQLVDAASAVANSRTKAEAITNAQRYATLYFGKAHIFAIDKSVADAKIAFYTAMAGALAKNEFPSYELQASTLALSHACKEVLRAQDVFGVTMLATTHAPNSAPPK